MEFPLERFKGFEDVRREIEAETLRVCGASLVSPEPILLRIFSATVMDLTLVDLPGLTQVPTAEQPKDMPQKIRQLVKSFVEKPSSIILAVSAANVDLATSDALALAREVDPEGLRTVGVLTKLDLDAENAVPALLGNVYPLRLGYTAVVCRNESHSQQGVTFEEALKAEADFFARHPKLQSLQTLLPALISELISCDLITDFMIFRPFSARVGQVWHPQPGAAAPVPAAEAHPRGAANATQQHADFGGELGEGARHLPYD